MKTKPKNNQKLLVFPVQRWKNSDDLLLAFQMQAIKQEWTSEQIDIVVNGIRNLDPKDQISAIAFYCVDENDPRVKVSQDDVQYMLEHLSMQTHYLYSKEIATWDEYDWSNYASLKRKATSFVKRVFALVSDNVMESEKYNVTTAPSIHFESFEMAESHALQNKISNYKIYSLWLKG